MKVAVTSPLPGDAVEALSERFEVSVHDAAALEAADELAEFAAGADGLLTLLANPVDGRLLDRCPTVRVVANCAVGVDNIDLEAARRRGVWVTNTPDVLTEATADLAWALVLAVTRRLVEADRYLRQGRYRGWALDLLLGRGVQGEQIGIVGYGRIGRAVARRAIAAGMRVAFADPRPPAAPDPPGVALELDELVATSLVVSLHAPLTPETHHLLDRERIARMRSDAFLVNTARGPLVDEAALVEALEAGRLAGAGLDVFENEPEVHPGLTGRDDVVLLPHVGSATVETRSAMAELAALNLAAVLEGREPPTPVVRGRR